MTNCHVSNQIAVNADDKEYLCPECGSLMFIELGSTSLDCSECDCSIEMVEEYYE